MELFIARFLALDRIPRLLHDSTWIDTTDKQIALLNRTISCDTCKLYPLPRAHVRSFLEAIVRTCETERLEVAEGVYEELAESLAPKVGEEVAFGFYTLPNDLHVVFQVEGDMDGTAFVKDGSTGFCTWEAGKCLAWFLSERMAPSRNLGSVLEIGCGTGVTGTAVSMSVSGSQLSQYIFTDYHESTLEQARDNCTRNGLTDASKYSFRQLDILACPQVEVDIIVGADILYDEELCRGLLAYLTSGKCRFREAYIMSTIRTEATYQVFTDGLKKAAQEGKLEWSVVEHMPMSEWIATARSSSGSVWGDFLDSATRHFDADIELVRIAPVQYS